MQKRYRENTFRLKIFIKKDAKKAAYRGVHCALLTGEYRSKALLRAKKLSWQAAGRMVITRRYLNTIRRQVKGSSLNYAHKFKTNFNLVLALLSQKAH